MKIKRKTLTSGFSLPLLSMGTWMIGGDTRRDLNCDEDTAIECIRHGIEAGLTCIDTAEMYGAGYTEELIGKAIKKFERRSLQIISKVSPQNLHYDDVLRAAEATLQRLKVDKIDVYLIHKPNPDIPIEETMKAMNTLRERGLIGEIGVSNFNTASLVRAQSALDSAIVLNQVHYNLVYREPELSGLLDHCQKNDVFLMAWRPLEKGTIFEGCSLLLTEISRKYQKSPAQIALNWLVSQSHVVAVSTMRRKKSLMENLDSLGWQMDPGDINKLRSNFPGQQRVSNREPLR